MKLSVNESGFSYIIDCFWTYIGDNKDLYACFILYVLAILILLIWKKDKEINVFVKPLIIWGLTVFNPIIAVPLVEILGLDERFYRFFWIVPAPFLIGYVLVKFIGEDKRTLKIVAFLVFGLVAIQFLNIIEASPNIENIYKIDNKYIEVAEIISEDKEENSVVALYDYQTYMNIRTYDAAIKTIFDYYDFMHTCNGQLNIHQGSVEYVLREEDDYNLLKYIFFYNQVCDPKELTEALENMEIDYIILPHNLENAYKMFTDSGCELLDSTEAYHVLKY